jgi:hypothetical protein
VKGSLTTLASRRGIGACSEELANGGGVAAIGGIDQVHFRSVE